jgi:hypothetical protein
MTLSAYDFIYGMAQAGAAFLAIIAGIIAISLFQVSKRQKELRAWKPLIIALVIFVAVEIFGSLKSFGFDVAPYWTHVLVSLLLGFVIVALVTQIHVNRGWKE